MMHEVHIDKKSGFCFGVKKAIQFAETELANGTSLYCLGDIVHNEKEVERLEGMGLVIIDHKAFFEMSECKVLIRAHGEPPEVYEYAKNNKIELIEGTCPVVLKLQEKIRKSKAKLKGQGTIVIFGKPNHPEVIGLNGQVDGAAIIVEDEKDLDNIDYSNQIVLYSQTTMSKEKYWELKMELESRLFSPDLLEANDTICGQVSNRAPAMEEFSSSVDAVIFVGGKKSSNSKVLFGHCQKVNKNSFFISSVTELKSISLKQFSKIGVCGATSTPEWLIEEVANEIETLNA